MNSLFLLTIKFITRLINDVIAINLGVLDMSLSSGLQKSSKDVRDIERENESAKRVEFSIHEREFTMKA